MASKPPDQKRKRGRPTGAPKLFQDASDRVTQGDNSTDDVGDESRPRKRGRKADKNTTASPAAPGVKNDGVMKRGRGRPSKQQEQKQLDASGTATEHRRPAKKPTHTSNKISEPAKGKPKPVLIVDDTVSTEPRRSGRERRSWNPDQAYGAKRSNASQDSSSPSEPKQRQSREVPEFDSPSSISRRSARGRGNRDPHQVSDSARSLDKKEMGTARLTKKPTSTNRAKSTQQEADEPTPEQQALAEQAAKGKKRRGRISQNVEDTTQESLPRDLKTKQGKEKTTSQGTVAESTKDGPTRRRGRPKASTATTEASETGEPSQSRAPRREQGSDVAKGSRQKKETPPQPRGNEVNVEYEAGESSEEESEHPFRHLKEITRNISRSKVAAKWNPLDVPSINTVSSFLAEAQRPVLFRLQNTNRRRENASVAMGIVSRRLRAKLIRGLPFPPPTMCTTSRANSGSHEEEFNFERVVDATQNLENTLNPLLHSVDLLEREIKKQEDALTKDYHSLHKLENNARSKTKEWREKTKREHALAPGAKQRTQGVHRELGDPLELVPPAEDGPLGDLFADLQDEELAMLSRQIGSHMESLRGNLQQIGGVVPAITKSKAALQQVLLKHLDEEQYDSILHG